MRRFKSTAHAQRFLSAPLFGISFASGGTCYGRLTTVC